jgi:hypothetical protein
MRTDSVGSRNNLLGLSRKALADEMEQLVNIFGSEEEATGLGLNGRSFGEVISAGRQHGIGPLSDFLAAAIQQLAPVHSPQFCYGLLPGSRGHVVIKISSVVPVR